MFVALVLMVMAAVLFEMRTRLRAMAARVALLEGARPRPWTPAARVLERTTDEAPLERSSASNSPTAPESVLPASVEGPFSFKEPEFKGQNGASTSPARTDAVEESFVKQDLVSNHPRSAPDDPVHKPRSFNFEELFGRRLPIWAGGVTLAVADVLLVKYSMDGGDPAAGLCHAAPALRRVAADRCADG